MNSLWPKIVVVIYICIIIIQAGAYFVGWYIPPFGIGGEIYLPYFMVSGPIVWMLADMIADELTMCIENVLDVQVLPVVRVIILPGFVNIVLGGIQWYFITKWVIQWYQKWKMSRQMKRQKKDNVK